MKRFSPCCSICNVRCRVVPEFDTKNQVDHFRCPKCGRVVKV